MERIYAFLPSVLLLACIAGATLLYLKLAIKRFGDNLKSVEWCRKNRWKIIWTIGTPKEYIWFPAVEELIFRAPLIIAFSAVSSGAWYGIFASSILFALTHWFGKKIFLEEIFSAGENGEQKSDDVMEEVKRLHAEKGRMIVVRKIFHVVFTLPFGILAGYYGIKYQSVWLAFGIHSAWNVIMPAIFPIIMLLVTIAFAGILALWDSLWDRVIRWRRKRRWKREGLC